MHRLLLVICLTTGCRSLFGLDDPKLSDASSGDGGGNVVIGGTVTGLEGTGLILRNNGTDDRLIASAGTFTFATRVPYGASYDVTVSTQPTNPSAMCTVTNGSGTATTDVTNIAVTCMPVSFTVGGNVAGFTAGGTIVLTNNAVDDKTITSNGAFTFATPIRSGQPFDVAIKTQSGEACSVVANTGSVGGGPVTTIVVVCGSNLYTVGGSVPVGGVDGLHGSVKLHNGSDTITINGNGSFAFPTPLQGGGSSPYNVTVTQQPSFPPAAQNCVVTNGSGTVGIANVTNVKVACTTRSFMLGGTVSGLRGTVEVQNGNATKTITSDGAFAFDTPLASGLTYAVSVRTQPQGQLCAVGSSTGTVANSDVTSVVVLCSNR